MQAGSFHLALGELLGAANFVTMVVVGAIALIHPFRIPQWPFMRDIFAFSVAAIIILFIIHDGDIYFSTSILLILYYAAYVLVVVFGSSLQKCLFNNQTRFSLGMCSNLLEPLIISGTPDSPTMPLDPIDVETVTERDPLIDRTLPEPEVDEYFGLPLDIHSMTTQYTHSRPASPVLTDGFNQMRQSARSSMIAAEDARSIFSRIQSFWYDLVTKFKITIGWKGAIRLPDEETEDPARLSAIFEEDILPESHRDLLTRTWKDQLKQSLKSLVPILSTWRASGWWTRIHGLLSIPADLIFSLTVPVIHKAQLDRAQQDQTATMEGDDNGIEDDYDSNNDFQSRLDPFVSSIQLFLAPLVAIFIFHDAPDVTPWISGSLTGLALAMIGYLSIRYLTIDRPALILSLCGFAMSVIWVYSISNELVFLIQTFGIIFSISETVLGLTVFAIGNSLLDLLTNLEIAKLVHIDAY